MRKLQSVKNLLLLLYNFFLNEAVYLVSLFFFHFLVHSFSPEILHDSEKTKQKQHEKDQTAGNEKQSPLIPFYNPFTGE
jgi:hypothetical protein